MAQDKRESERRLSAYRGIVTIILGIILLIRFAGHDYGWDVFLLVGICFAFGVFSLVWAFRS